MLSDVVGDSEGESQVEVSMKRSELVSLDEESWIYIPEVRSYLARIRLPVAQPGCRDDEANTSVPRRGGQ